MKRCFIGLKITADARRQLAAVGDVLRDLPRSAAQRLRPVKAESLHLTLKFLGPTPDGQVPELVASLGEIAAGFGEVGADIVGLGAFPTPTQPRIVWAGLSIGRERVLRLMELIDEACEIHGVAREKRALHPHVTVARVERARNQGPITEVIASWADHTFGRIEGSTLVLFESQLQRSGAVYTPLAELSLTDDPAP